MKKSMKTAANNSTTNVNTFAKFQKAVISKEQLKMVKGGDGDVIGVEEGVII